MFEELERDLCEITGYDKFSFQPNRWGASVILVLFHAQFCVCTCVCVVCAHVCGVCVWCVHMCVVCAHVCGVCVWYVHVCVCVCVCVCVSAHEWI